MASSTSTVHRLPAGNGASLNFSERASQFIVRRRILLSMLLFGGVVGVDLAKGTETRDLFNYHDPWGLVGCALVIAGVALRSWAVGILHKDQELTTSGPYRMIRNPLYVGSFGMMLGFCVLIADPTDILIIVGPVMLIYAVTVRSEEKVLAKKFPEQWAEYARTTPRFIPRLAKVDLSANWRSSQWLRHREYQALMATIAGLVALKILHLS